MKAPVAMAIGAHPDDIEFLMAGTLVLLRRVGCQTHYLNVANGSCGSAERSTARTVALRRRESRSAARILGAVCHRSLTNDLEIFYDHKTLRRLAAVLREVRPQILLVPSPQDYMEDHTNTCRLAVTAAFARGMRNYRTVPARGAVEGEVTVYHAMPQGLRDPLRRRVRPGAYVNTTSVHQIKRTALAAHRSQKDWLDVSQGIGSYLRILDEMSLAVGKLSRRFQHAEGWRRHSHWGFCGPQADPLAQLLGPDYHVDAAYERALGRLPGTTL